MTAAAPARLTFLGTRGYIELRTRRHRYHSAALLEVGGLRVMVDCGEDWRRRVQRLAPDCVLVTHAHPDHAFGLGPDAPCPVYATEITWRYLAGQGHAVPEPRLVQPRVPFSLGELQVEAFEVVHSLRCPAVGYRLQVAATTVFYVPDVVAIPERTAALQGVDLYVGDGATLTRPLVRRQGDRLFGHTTVRAQLGWCQQEAVPRAIFTHCGLEIVGGDGRQVAAQVRALGKARGVEARIAYDGLTIGLAAAAR